MPTIGITRKTQARVTGCEGSIPIRKCRLLSGYLFGLSFAEDFF